jgi:GH15 family glucan-1,4-alpha-glucosidase
VRRGSQQFTQSKMMCAIALDRAVWLADAGRIPGGHPTQWKQEAAAIRAFVDERCWSDGRGSYVRNADGDEIDASLLVAVLFGYADPRDPRLLATVEAIRRELSHGPFVYRYSGEDGLTGQEGAFVACSFWLVEAMALQGRRREAAELMNRLVGLANDVGLYAEEVDPHSGEFLGNLPQALSHLGLIHAALAFPDGVDFT